MTKFFIFIISSLFLNTNSFAAPAPAQSSAAPATEIFYQPEAGAADISAGITYTNGNTKKTSSTNVKTTTKSTRFTPGIGYDYGINENIALGASIEYASAESKNSSASGDSKSVTTGLSDLKLELKGRNPLVDGKMLWFGATLAISPGDSTSKETSADKTEYNNYSGGHILTPYVGFSAPVSGYTLSIKLTQEMGLGDKTLKETDVSGVKTTYKASGGNTTVLSFIGEMPTTSGIVGLELDYATVAEMDITTGVGSGTMGGSNIGLLTGFGRCSLNKTTVLLWRLGYSQVLSDKVGSDKVNSSSIIVGQLGARFAF